MNIVDFWKDITDKWQTESKCGFCWKFEAPLIESQSNIVKESEQDYDDSQCCAYVFLTSLSENDVTRFSENTNFPNGINRDHSFTVHFVIKGKLGVNNYSEIKDHPISESNWENIYKPIKDCINSTDFYELICEFLNKKVTINQWRKELSYAYLDNNYMGWKITAILREEI